MRDIHLLRGEYVGGIGALELRFEQARVQAGWIHRPACAEPVRVPVHGQAAADDSERTADTPGTQIEIVDDGVAEPVPVVGEIECAAAEIGAKRNDRVCRDEQLVEIALGGADDRPGGLPVRTPVDAAVDIELQGIGRPQLADP